jgi:hypothetical protein
MHNITTYNITLKILAPQHLRNLKKQNILRFYNFESKFVYCIMCVLLLRYKLPFNAWM